MNLSKRKKVEPVSHRINQNKKKINGVFSAVKGINHTKSIYFQMPDIYNLKSNKNLVVLSHYSAYQQTTTYSCGPACALTVLQYYGCCNYTERELMKKMKTTSKTGTNVKNMANFFNSIGWNVQTNLESKRFSTYKEFKKFVVYQLKSGHPILVENVSWGGHWRVIIGYDTMGTISTVDDVIIFMEPYDTVDHNQDGYRIENGEHFFDTWFDCKVLPDEEREQPFVLAYPKEITF